MSRLSLGTKLASAFALTLILMLIAAAVAVTKMGALADRTADAKQGAVLDEQIMSMEIAAREALDVESTAILYGAPTALDGRLDAVRDEEERRPALHLHRLPGVMGEDEDGCVEGQLVAPPSR